MTAPADIPALIAEGRRLIAAATPGPVETSLHEKLTTVGDTNHWTVKEHEFPQPPYEGQLTEEWGVYPPLGEAGPVALVSGPHNAALFVFAVNNLPALLAVAEAADKREATLRAAAREALTVLTRLADSAAYWSDYDVPVGLVAEVDAAKARLAGVLV